MNEIVNANNPKLNGKLKNLSKSKKYLLVRLFWYLVGLFLFFAPFALFQRFLINILKIEGRKDIHGACFRMFVQDLFTGKIVSLSQALTTTGIIVSLTLLTAFLAGPFFCGKLCTAGAIPEYLSRLVPDKFKIDLQGFVNPAAVRYGIFAAFLLSPSLGLSVICAYCNYTIVERLTTGINVGDIGILGSSTIITAFIWLFLLGAFVKGGRGYCTFLCPIGASQNLLHAVGARLPFTYKLKYAADKCVSCSLCVKDCPTRSLKFEENQLKYNILTCNTCQQCQKVCPKSAIYYGNGESGWQKRKFPSVVSEEPVTVLKE